MIHDPLILCTLKSDLSKSGLSKIFESDFKMCVESGLSEYLYLSEWLNEIFLNDWQIEMAFFLFIYSSTHSSLIHSYISPSIYPSLQPPTGYAPVTSSTNTSGCTGRPWRRERTYGRAGRRTTTRMTWGWTLWTYPTCPTWWWTSSIYNIIHRELVVNWSWIEQH